MITENEFFGSPDLCISVMLDTKRRIREVLDRREFRLDNPKCQVVREYEGMRFSRKKRNLIALLLVSQLSNYFQPFSEYLRVEIYNECRNQKKFPVLAAASLVNYLGSCYLLLNSNFLKPRVLFGTVLTEENIEEAINSVSLREIKKPRPRKTQRHRGYRDHGTLRPSHLWNESSDITWTEMQNTRESEIQLYDEVVQLLVEASFDWISSYVL